MTEQQCEAHSKKIETILDEQSQIKSSIKDIHAAVCGDDFGNEGLVSRVKTCETKIRGFENASNWITATSATISACVAGLAWLLSFLFK